MAGHVLPVGGGGIVRYTLELASALAERPDEVILHLGVNTRAEEWFRDTFPTARVHPVQRRTGGLAVLDEHLAGLAPFRRRIEAPVDVVHSVKHIAPLFTRGARSVLTVHDMLLVDRPLDYSRSKRLLLRVPYGLSLTRADLLICVSDATRQRLLSYYPELERRTVVVPLAASPRMLDSPGEPVPALDGRTFGVVVGDGLARKNLAFLGTVWHRLTRQRPDLVLAVVGSGATDLPELSARWREMLAEGAAVALPRITDDALAWCYRNTAVALCPSYMEGFGLPAAEAAAVGTPVVVSEDPALSAAAPASALRAASWDVDSWATAVEKALAEGRPTAGHEPVRRWADVADETIRAIRTR
ncbi:MAG: glycosyltransferase family 4 protein [Pseudonocardia sp.]|nr:glycosyltransferase family 4 protein [Pseudonocardia sp.]